MKKFHKPSLTLTTKASSKPSNPVSPSSFHYLSYISTGKSNTPKLIEVPFREIAQLEPGEWLSDHLVDLGLSLWFERFQASSLNCMTLKVLSTYFFTNFSERGYAAIAHWTRKWTPLTYDFIVIPIHDTNHWYSSIIIGARQSVQALPKSGEITIISIDSLSYDRANTRKSVAEWLLIEFAKHYPGKPTPSIVSLELPVPRQPNLCDCALYMIHYVDRFIRHHQTLLPALTHNDSFALDDPATWRTDLAAHARADFGVQVQHYACIAKSRQ
ncbi:hypothetical protein M422DRAFT_265216 [Sphaerobolus stellatus SS14]|uniref:Ubiquitin-like protease family profile domain-containing protein n=1 Tax=Sphaerobolus stellatus (strain SS14) TaxID=990650 RepID=A0A0C9UDU7_SPHS4|nr:hypothetical protein M422DRAFT_265216 [Sphaerobolus stellatus SS14]